jgi:hypothetical protein
MTIKAGSSVKTSTNQNRKRRSSSNSISADVLTSEEPGKLLAPLINPLPSFEEMVLGKKAA